ncbi:hypothetical protein PD280_21305 [Virgibacillus salarius]|uniref:coiled-coil domain-containing protein n=1 Tax=Virgibacillus salarius TaxID=447199 RepID=UPI0024917C82|nr:hypothetical protein [Virgibacillus salarius]WBX80106.1 hypothetical protein PD280_21305 [Virgibacillus salarius]
MKKLLFLLITLLVISGCSNKEATAEVEGEAMNLAEIKEEKEKNQDELDKVNNEINKAKEELSDLEELKELAENRKQVEKDLQESKSELEVLKKDIERAENGLKEKRDKIIEAKKEPIKLDAGFYYIGEDIPESRYILKPQEGYNGNVFVRNENGSKVAESFGSRGGYLKKFTFDGLDGEEIEATIPILLYPAE